MEEFVSHRGTEKKRGTEGSGGISDAIIGEAIEIHRELGPGLFENVYEQVLAASLTRRGFRVERQVAVPLQYRGLHFEQAYRLDLIVEDEIIVEVKSIERLLPVHAKQLLTYLRLYNRRVGLLINFGGETLKEGVKRVLNG